MYRRGYGRWGFGWLPIVLGIFVLMMLFSGGFHRPWFFIWPLFCFVPLVLAGLAVFCGTRRSGFGPKRKYGDWYYGEKPKRTGDSESDIYYV
jgi:hypothetical protein